MTFVSLFVGFAASIGVLVTSFFAIGKFSLESGVSPLLLAMVTFFSLTFGSYVYVWAAHVIFPLIYVRMKYFFLHVTAYMIVLFIVMMPVYLTVSSVSLDTSAVLFAYLIHILLGIFGIEIIASLISQYRYTILSFYANVSSLVISGGIIFLVYEKFSASGSALFVLMGLSVLGFVLSTLLVFLIKSIYYKYYMLTGTDPIGDMFLSIQEEEDQKIRDAKNQLLTKK